MTIKNRSLLLVACLFLLRTSPVTALEPSFTFSPIVVPGETLTVSVRINNAGQIVGGYGCCAGGVESHGFLLYKGTLTTIDFPGASGTAATAVNDSGQIVGIYFASGTNHGFLNFGGVFSTIDFPGATLTQVFEINNRGEIVGEYIAGGENHGFLYSDGTFSTIDVPGATATTALGINDGGADCRVLWHPPGGRAWLSPIDGRVYNDRFRRR